MASSRLALRGTPDGPGVLRSICRVLVLGGRHAESIARPFSDTPFHQSARDESGASHRLRIDCYFGRDPVQYACKNWAHEFAASAYRATPEGWFGMLMAAGFDVRAGREPRPSAAVVCGCPVDQ